MDSIYSSMVKARFCALWRPLGLLLMYLLSWSLYAQVEIFPIESFSTDNGLTHGTVWQITKDKRGFIWVGTSNGLNRYDGYNLKAISLGPDAEALTSNQIRALYCDERGNLWMGTAVGLDRLDPDTGKITPYRHDPGNPLSISDDYVTAIVAAAAGQLWVGTQKGLNLLDPEKGEFSTFLRNSENRASLGETWVRVLWSDPNGQLWVGTNDGLFRYDPLRDRFTEFRHEPGNRNSISHPQIRALYRDSEGRLWVGTTDGLNLFDESNNTFRRMFEDQPGQSALTDPWINVIRGDHFGTLWVGTRAGGLFGFRSGEESVRRLGHGQIGAGLPSNNILDIYPDSNGLLWVGTYKAGFAKLDLKPTKFRHFRVVAGDPQTSPDVTAIHQSQADVLWLGTRDSLIRHDAAAGRTEIFRHDPQNPTSIAAGQILSVFGDPRGRMWIGTEGGGLNLFLPETSSFRHFRLKQGDPNSLSGGSVYSLAGGADDHLWVGSDIGLQRFSVREQLFLPRRYLADSAAADLTGAMADPTVTVVFEGQDGLVWAGTDKGLFRLNPEDGQVRRFNAEPGAVGGLCHSQVTSITEDRDGRLWVGTANGLNRYDAEKQSFQSFPQIENLPSGWINGMVVGFENELWLSTNGGIVRFDADAASATVFDREDGLQSRVFNRGAAFKSSRGEIFFGGPSGYNSFFPGRMVLNAVPPPIAITAFNILDQEVSLPDRINEDGELVLSHRENFFSLEFAAMDFSAPSKNRFSYKLEGFDQDWIDAGHRHYAAYTNLNGGHYKFLLRAANSDGTWNLKGLDIPIWVIPPVWQRLWFILLVFVVLILVAYGIHRYWIRHIKLDQLKLVELAAERTEALREAHFQLAGNARKAGIAEINTGILHNVGNILNSVAISADEILHLLRYSKLSRIQEANELVRANMGNLTHFLTQDSRGKIIPDFFENVAYAVTAENRDIAHEANILLDKIALMGQAVSMEQSYAGRYARREKVDLAELINNALLLQEASLRKRDIQVLREFKTVWPCQVETHKLVQVITNLIKNAMEAIPTNAFPENRRIFITLQPGLPGFNEIWIRDKGIGIDPTHLAFVFDFGFTTKEGGHGYGLHSCLKTMRESGGDIWVESDGIGRGSTFVLKIPIDGKAPRPEGETAAAAEAPGP